MGPVSPANDTRMRIGSTQLNRVADEGLSLVRALEALEAEIALAREAPPDVLALATRAAELRKDLDFLLRADDTGFVYYLDVRGRGVFLRASPIDVSSIVADLLLDRMNGTVLTSATLTVDGSFEYVRSRLGIRRAQRDPAAVGVRLFEAGDSVSAEAHARSALARVRRRGRAGSDRDRQAHRGARVRPVHQLRQPARSAGERVGGNRVSDPGAGNGAALGAASRFQSDAECGPARHLELLAGGRCRRRSLELRDHRQVAVRLAGRPDHRRRGSKQINAAGGSAFGEYQIPLAILALQQGLGRLIRHREDRGVLAVLDPRLRSMGYGRRFLNSLPPAPVTTDLPDITRFFSQ